MNSRTWAIDVEGAYQSRDLHSPAPAWRTISTICLSTSFESSFNPFSPPERDVERRFVKALLSPAVAVLGLRWARAAHQPNKPLPAPSGTP
jgi:hypothetical protein